MDDNGEGTTFMQWRQRAQSEVNEDRPGQRVWLIVMAVVVIIAIVAAVVIMNS